MHVATAEAISSHMRASIEPVLSLSVSARYCPAPVFFSRTDIDDTAKNDVTAAPSNFAASTTKKSFMPQHTPAR